MMTLTSQSKETEEQRALRSSFDRRQEGSLRFSNSEADFALRSRGAG